MKKIINVFLVITMILALVSMPVSAEDNITVYVNEKMLQCDVAPYIENGKAMIPMRKIFEALDAKVDWEKTTQTITATKDGVEIILQINNSTMKINGVDEALDAAPVIVGSVAFVPVRAVCQSLKADVEWIDYNQSIYIDSPVLFKQASENITKTVTMYAPDGRTIDVLETEIEAYKNVGWYIEPVTQMYALDGRTIYVFNSEVEAYKNVGWYLTPVITMYAIDGRSIIVSQDEAAAYQSVGWYLTPVVTMYAPNGRSIIVSQDEAAAYQSVGWYLTRKQAQAANRVTNTASRSSNPSADGYYYRTPTGKRYHLDPNCGGKNSRRTTNISGLSPCSKCAK